MRSLRTAVNMGWREKGPQIPPHLYCFAEYDRLWRTYKVLTEYDRLWRTYKVLSFHLVLVVV